nr:uncharacterized protein LOC109153947 [Ipomoea batatas]
MLARFGNGYKELNLLISDIGERMNGDLGNDFMLQCGIWSVCSQERSHFSSENFSCFSTEAQRASQLDSMLDPMLWYSLRSTPSHHPLWLAEQYGLENNTSIVKLEELLKGRLSCGGNDFKRTFVLYCLSTFLTPTANRKVDFTVVKSLINVGEIGYFDRSQYVLDRLCATVSRYNKSTTQKHLKQIMLEEIFAGDFGQGELDNSTYHISSSKVATKFEGEVLRERSSSRTCDEIKEKSSRVIKFTIPKGELDNNEIHKIAKDVVENFLAIKKLSEAMPLFDLLTPDEENDDQMANIVAENDGDYGIEDYMIIN